MKIKITLLFLVATLSTNLFYAQTESIGSSDYGRIFNITYDPNVENKLYATSLYNHILVSHNNGGDWEVLFSMSVHDVTKFKDLKMTKNNTALSFIKYNENSSDNILIIFDLISNTVINEIEIPYLSVDRYIRSYSIYDEDQNIILMHTKLDYGQLENTYYTTDGGINWDLVYTKTANDGVTLNSVAINPNNPNNLILTRGLGPTDIDGGLFVSNDAGQTWEDKLPGVVLAPIAFSPHDEDDILVGTGVSFGDTVQNLYRSNDGGDTWQAIPISWTDEQLNDIIVIAFDPNNANKIILLEENEVVISTDNGNSWINYVYDSSNVHGYYYGTDLSFNPFNEDELFITSNWHPQFSNDGGVTLSWSKNNKFLSTGTLGLSLQGNEHLYYGVQQGFVHRDLVTGLENSFDILPIDWYNQNDSPTLYVDEYVEGRVFTFSGGWFGSDLKVSDDHGQSKYQILNTFMNYFDAVGTDPYDVNTVWFSFSNTSGNSELISVNISDFNSIETQGISLPENGFIRGIHFDPQNQGHVLITIGTKVYKTEDYGSTWNISSTGLEQLTPSMDLILNLDHNPFNTEELAIATNKGIFKSLDGGSTWNQIYSSLVHQVFFSDIVDGHIVGTVHTSGISDYSLIYSLDQGQNWNHIANEELLSVGSIDSKVKFVDANSAEIYIATIDLGLVKHTLNFQTLGIDESEIQEGFIDLYPNPAKDTVKIISSGLNIESVSVFDLTGKMVHQSAGKETIDISSLPSGIYLLKAKLNSGKFYSKKLVKI